MTVLDFHILIEQDVQKISSFAYEDLQSEEIDIQANKAFYKWLDSFAEFQQRGNRLDDTEARLNDIRTLVVRDSSLSLVGTGGVSVASFPDNYLYLLGIRLTVYYECNTKRQEVLVPNEKYVLKSSIITVDGHTYTKGDLVTTTITTTLSKSDILYELSSHIVTGRIVRNEEVGDLNDSHYGRTSYRSPLVGIDTTGIYISTQGKFFIDIVEAVFIRKPAKIDSNSPDSEIDLPINGCYKLAQKTVEEILKVTEQPQQKIENLKLTQ